MVPFSATVVATAIANTPAHSVPVAVNAIQSATAPSAREVMDRYKRKRDECDRNALPSETNDTNRMTEQQLQRYVLLRQLDIFELERAVLEERRALIKEQRELCAKEKH